MEIKDFIGELKKGFGDQVITLESSKISVISTGSLSLDISTGIGGIPKGRFTELYGSEGTGKSTVAICTSGQVILSGGRVLYIDNESTLDYGLVRAIIPNANESNFVVANPTTLEDSLRIALSGIDSGLFDLIVFDSIPALPSEEEVEKGLEKDSMMILPRKVQQLLKLTASKVRTQNVAVLLINQVRDNTNSYFGGFRTPGGHALKHFNTVEIALTRGKAIENKDKERVGGYTKFVIKKNKLAVPFRSAEFPLLYGAGIDYLRDVLEFASLLGIIKKRGSYLYYNDENIGQGMENASEVLRENPEMLETIVNTCYEKVIPDMVRRDLTEEE